MKYLVVILLLFVFSEYACTTPVATTSNTTSVQASEIEKEILDQVNRYRRTKGMVALTMNNEVNEEARQHSRNMATGSTPFGHDGFSARAKRLQGKITGFRGMAENVAYGQLSAKEVVADWISSPGHKINIEGNYTQTGIGVVANKKGVLYYTQIFVK